MNFFINKYLTETLYKVSNTFLTLALTFRNPKTLTISRVIVVIEQNTGLDYELTEFYFRMWMRIFSLLNSCFCSYFLR